MAAASPLLTAPELVLLCNARDAGAATVQCTLDLRRSVTSVDIGPEDWSWSGRRFPYPERIKERTIYHWAGESFEPVARYSGSLIKLVPTDWGPPTFEIDGIKMLPSAQVSPYADAERKVDLIEPKGKYILDTCGGLGYFAAWCVQRQAARVQSYEINPDVVWLRSLNPWSPASEARLTLMQQDVTQAIAKVPTGSVDAVLHDPPRFGIAGELYSQRFYDELARVLKRRGKLFHYTGSPNRLTSGRDVPTEVSSRLHYSGFRTEKMGDGIVAIKQ
jgi:hypothetical protein